MWYDAFMIGQETNTTITGVMDDVTRLADERMGDLLPRVLEKIIKRGSIGNCIRHDVLLYGYVQSQVKLSRAKREYHRADDSYVPCDMPYPSTKSVATAHTRYVLALAERDAKRREYRSYRCTCLVARR